MNNLTHKDLGKNQVKEINEVSQFIAKVQAYREGKRNMITFNELPEVLKNKIDARSTSIKQKNEYVKLIIDNMFSNRYADNNESMTMEDIETGEKIKYEDTLAKEYEETIKPMYNMIADTKPDGIYESPTVIDTYEDAVSYKSLNESCKTKIKNIDKRLKNIKRDIISYYHINYNHKKEIDAQMDISKIPDILRTHFDDGINNYDDRVFDYFLLHYIDHVSNNNIKSEKIEDHVYLMYSVRSIYDLNYISRDSIPYLSIKMSLTNVLNTLTKTYDLISE